MDLVLFGIQGSGKGTQAKRLSAEQGYTIFEAGGALRSIVARNNELGQTVASFINNGKLVPNDILMSVVQEAVSAIPADQKILFDGVPRFEEQMHSFNEMMKTLGRNFVCVHIALDETQAIERILSRGQIEGRVDDQDEQKIRTRLSWFYEKSMPVINAYAERGMVIEVNGDGTMDEVYERILEALSVTA